MDETLAGVDEALRALSRGLRTARLHREACRAAGVDLDPPGFSLLGLLGEGPTRLTQLACRVGLDPSTISRKLQELERSGLVTREADQEDRRAAMLRLSPEGQDVAARLQRARLESLSEVLADWSERDRRELARLLARFAHSLAQRDGKAGVAR